MSTTMSVTIRLDQAEYERLRSDALSRGVLPEELAGEYVRVRLNGQSELAEERKQRGLAALDRFDALREEIRAAGYPSVDAVQAARESREELERRPSF